MSVLLFKHPNPIIDWIWLIQKTRGKGMLLYYLLAAIAAGPAKRPPHPR
jgi:hypothetical protein